VISGAHGAIVGMAVACAVCFAVLFTLVAGELRGAPPGTALPPEAAAYARLQTATVVLGTLVKRGGTIAMPILGASAVQTGFAAIATGLGTAGVATTMSLLTVQLPRLAERMAVDPDDAERQAAGAARAALVIAIAAALSAALLAGPAIDLALGSQFADAQRAVELALPAVPLGAALGLASLVGALRLRPGAVTASWAMGSLAFLVLAVATIPSLDAKGASIATTGGELVASLAAAVLVGGRAMRGLSAASVAGACLVLAAGALA
jgi:O-antigen/teichoic acid export membrane protein